MFAETTSEMYIKQAREAGEIYWTSSHLKHSQTAEDVKKNPQDHPSFDEDCLFAHKNGSIQASLPW